MLTGVVEVELAVVDGVVLSVVAGVVLPVVIEDVTVVCFGFLVVVMVLSVEDDAVL